MKSTYSGVLLLMFSCLLACSESEEPSGAVEPVVSYGAFEDASKNPDASITHDGDWTVVARTENGDRVFWFVAPDVDKVSPALFKKTIHVADNNEIETTIVSKCEAPKQVCDELMENFKTLSEKYK